MANANARKTRKTPRRPAAPRKAPAKKSAPPPPPRGRAAARVWMDQQIEASTAALARLWLGVCLVAFPALCVAWTVFAGYVRELETVSAELPALSVAVPYLFGACVTYAVSESTRPAYRLGWVVTLRALVSVTRTLFRAAPTRAALVVAGVCVALSHAPVAGAAVALVGSAAFTIAAASYVAASQQRAVHLAAAARMF